MKTCKCEKHEHVNKHKGNTIANFEIPDFKKIEIEYKQRAKLQKEINAENSTLTDEMIANLKMLPNAETASVEGYKLADKTTE